MLHTSHTPGRTVLMDNRECLFFSGFSYLGLHQHPAFKAYMAEGIEKYGTLFPSSRVSNLRLSLYEEIEHALATQLQQQSAVVFSSGYLSGQAAIHYATTCGELLYAPGTHPALWHHTPALPAASRTAWEQETITRVNDHPDNTYVIVSDTMNPITATVYNFDWLTQLKHKVLVLLDDSHGIGILGPQGKGSIHQQPHGANIRYLVTASLAKAYSVEGGVVAGTAADVAAMKRTPYFTGSTPMMPASAHAWLQAAALISEQQHLLKKNTETATHYLKDIPHTHHPELAIFIFPQYDNRQSLATYLADKDLIISSFPYPLPHHAPVHRAIISALHQQQDIATLYQFLHTYYQ
ncbi:aminotransferase class I/II-fold pyridoxal phosphate-dependent enzyme [Chitinophaga sp. Cy-1792]|uniref:aminotransferase class I/II-fold pyridoxal phosphate-dependent enzyme n=1 Tax=Chitinophaga sp. Cy-1792 TaxID=2608339 RepID=UPI0014218ECD|nr:aminotransferase class I/II-fold pyridoxal phosphate-dependent enzyme [Chitinophaga sp. Cy-1792]NIG53978.1 pyridoxal phosphate-dependent aminotransferase family protein [Chitinophaga sp. Cy-1792]